jgi:acetolactate synthase-1/2/3 large subunit
MKPVILLGAGYRHMDKSRYADILNKYPVLTTWAAIDAVPEKHPTYCGRPGTMGRTAMY